MVILLVGAGIAIVSGGLGMMLMTGYSLTVMKMLREVHERAEAELRAENTILKERARATETTD